MIPTKEQIQWLWEQCGWKVEGGYKSAPYLVSHSPNGQKYMSTLDEELIYLLFPPIDLNNLFKYAVPGLRYANIQYSDQYPGAISPYSAAASIQFADHHTWVDDDPALALFWAIYKALGGEE